MRRIHVRPSGMSNGLNPEAVRKARIRSAISAVCEELESRQLLSTPYGGQGNVVDFIDFISAGTFSSPGYARAGKFNTMPPFQDSPCPTCGGGRGAPGAGQGPPAHNKGGPQTTQSPGAITAGNLAVDAASGHPITYFSGTPVVSSTDLWSDGFGTGWGQSRSWNDAVGDGLNGYGWLDNQLPFIARNGTDDYYSAITSSLSLREFHHTTTPSSGYEPLLTGSDSLADDASNHLIVLTDPVGNQVLFHDFSSSTPSDQQGFFAGYRDADGHSITVTDANNDGRPEDILRQDTTGSTKWKELWHYEYFDSANANSGKIKSITLSRKEWTSSEPGSYTDEQRVDYGYYDSSGIGGNEFGQLGDLKTAAITDLQPLVEQSVNSSGLVRSSDVVTAYVTAHGFHQGDTVVIRGASDDSYNGTFVIDSVTTNTFTYVAPGASGTATGGKVYKPFDVTYYRYYASGEAGGFSHGLKYVVYPQSYARLASATSNAMTAGNTTLDIYADNYFEYNATSHRVTKEVAQGAGCSCSGNDGRGEYTYAYTDNNPLDNSSGFQPNRWAERVAETLPDGTMNYVYLNEYGEVLLKEFQLADESAGGGYTGDRWGWFNTYDDDGRLVMSGGPASLQLPSTLATLESHDTILDNRTDSTDANGESDGNFYYIRDAAGLISENVYGTSSDTLATTSSAGAVVGYLKEQRIRQGETGTAIKQLSQDYIARNGTLGGVSATIYPVHSTTVYEDTAGSAGRTTQYAYDWYGSTLQIKQIHTTLPTVSEAKNGPGTSVTLDQQFDEYGQLTWSRDGGGFINRYIYDLGTGALEQQLVDVDTTAVTGEPNEGMSGAWITPSGGGLGLETDLVVDGLGRPTKMTVVDAVYGDRTTYIVYNDANYEVRTYQGWNDTTHTPTGPIVVQREYRPLPDASSGQQTLYDETLTTSATPSLDGSNNPTGQETISASNVQELTRRITNYGGQVVEVDRYFSLSDGMGGLVTYATATPQLGTVSNDSNSGNYHAAKYTFNHRGQVAKVEAHTLSGAAATNAATITRYTYDGLMRPTGTWIGTNDTGATFDDPDGSGGANNMIQVSSAEYDGGGVGDSNLTKQTLFPTGSTSPRVTETFYDFRNRPVAVKSGVGTSESESVQRRVTYTEYDNLDRVVVIEDYDGDTVTIGSTSGVPDRPSASRLRAKTTLAYDEQGQLYRTDGFNIDPSTGATNGTSLKTWNWYDTRGDLKKTLQPGGLATKYTYDGAGRVVKQYATDSGGDVVPGSTGNWDNAQDVEYDNVLQQAETTYDAAGNAIFVTTRQHFHDDGNMGELSNISGTPKARVSYQAFYYDKANRVTDSVDVGTNGGSAYTRPSTAPTSRSNVLLLTHNDYNSAGELETVTDPRGIMSKTYYDLLGRMTKMIANYVDGVAANADDDQITQYTYNGNDDILTMKAVVNNSGIYSGTNNLSQTTQYVYGVTTGGGSSVNSNDLLAHVKYPDKTTGSPSTNTADIESFTYDALGERKTFADRNGSTHTYSYDVLGRLLTDNVTTLGSGVDGTVRRLDYNYDSAGRPYQMTSFGNTNGSGTPLNQVQYAYNGYGQVTTEYQEHSGAVSTSTSPKIQYAYTEGGSNLTTLADNNSRLTSITYPNGRVLRYEYGTSLTLNNRIGRLAFLADQANGAASTHIEEYSYLGLSTVVIRNRPSANSKLTYVKQTGESDGDAGDQYTGLDRFGRIVDQRWIGQSGSSTTTLDRFQYGYDANSNPLYKNNLGSGTVAATFSELYHANGTSGAGTSYDGLNRLTDFRRGTLSDVNSDGAYDTVSTLNTLGGSQKNWNLDAVGNWNSSTTNGTTTSRTHDLQNEVTAVGSNALTFDNNGNTTTDETGHALTYDAWNRLATYSEVIIDAGGGDCCGGDCCGGGGGDPIINTLESQYYDALGRRITTHAGAPGDAANNQQMFYSNQWQVLEQQEFCDDGTPVSGSHSQFVWSPTYVDELVERDRDVDSSADGTLDTSFDTDGKLTTTFGSSSSNGYAVAVQSDGKTVVAGEDGANGGEIALVRYNRDGSLDSTFGTGGKVSTNFSGSEDRAFALVIQPDGRIVVGGSSGTTRFALARYNADGTLDNSFDSDGKLTTHVLTGSSGEEVTSLALQPDGKIVAGGYAYDGTTFDIISVVARYNADGTLDGSFDSDGIKLLSTPAGDLFTTVAIQANGKIDVGRLGQYSTFEVEQLSGDDGALDTSFGSSGIATASFSGSNVLAFQGLTLQADGKILAAGVVSPTSGNYRFGVARFTTTGALDSSFGTGGQVTTDVAASDDQAIAVRAQSDGKIVVAGIGGGGDFGVVRYNENGSLDTTFDTDGKVTTDFGAFDVAEALWISPDYKITAAGWTGSTPTIAVARYKVASNLEERLYAQTDANHNVTSVADVFGAVKQRFVYDPYGTATVLTSAWATTSDGYNWNITSQGGRLDTVTGLIRHGVRDQSVSLGRWIEQDPLGYPDGANRYETDRSDPTHITDPSGLIGLIDGSSVMGGLGRLSPNGHKYDGQTTAELMRKILDLQSRKNYDYACHGGQPGPYSLDLWNEIQRIKKEVLFRGDEMPYHPGEDPNYWLTLGQGVLNAINGGTDLIFDYDWSKDLLAHETEAEHNLSVRFGEGGFASLLLARALSKGAQKAVEGACKSTCFVAGTPVLLGDGQTEEAIEQIHVGQRVATDGGVANGADGKTKADDPNATEVDPKTWRLVNLEIDALTEDGRIDVMEVQELMPLTTLLAEHAAPGMHIPVPLDLGDINEVGQGAIVESIDPCPQIESGPGRVVLTTITHLNDYGFHLTLADATGNTETLGITGFHKMYTEDRAWTSAADLQIGELVRGDHGDLRVVGLTRDPGVHRVYNLTVEADHVYYVGDLAALSHNTKDCKFLRSEVEDALRKLRTELKDLEEMGESGSRDYLAQRELYYKALEAFKEMFSESGPFE